MIKLNSKQLRLGESKEKKLEVKKQDIYIILENVLDTYNVGAIFRLADAVSAKKVFLCGGTSSPPNPRIKKSSINTTEWVEWEYCETASEAVSRLKREAERVKVVAIEQSKKSVPYDKFDYSLPICLVVGNETYGVLKKTLEVVDSVVELPMYGVNISLNVMVSLGIVLYHVLSKTRGKTFG
ncbi:TrmH family RNA methyltransferase [Candidatus Daviesbacteria bacterium]|nr:TrmH family RNA methyltransferase [Candidatus Daviesbacteria bacterium]